MADAVGSRPLRVERLIATRKSDPERGPQVSLNPEDAALRLLTDGELAWVNGPRRNELAEVRIDASLPKGAVVLRDVLGASPSEIVRVVKPDLDTPRRAGAFA